MVPHYKLSQVDFKESSITFMSLKDIDAVHKIEESSFTNPWPKNLLLSELNNPFSYPFTLNIFYDRKEIVVGYTIFWVISGQSHLLNIAVHPDYRRMGFGRKLMDFIIASSVEFGVREILLEVRKSNISAQSLYKSVGFNIVGVRKGYYSDNKEDAILMTMFLQ